MRRGGSQEDGKTGRALNEHRGDPSSLPVFLSLSLFILTCGYRPVYGGEASERLHVALVRSVVPDAVASDEVVSGVREELAQGGALAAGEGFPRVEVEVLRIDEASEGIAGVAGAPVARGTEVGLIARAWLVRSAGAEHERDTGDVRAMEVVATDADPRADFFHHEDAVRAVARRVGHKLGAHILGMPSAGDEGPGRER
jgi:hypothetical protein